MQTFVLRQTSAANLREPSTNLAPMAPKKASCKVGKQVGPKFLRNAIVDLDSLSVDDPNTGWRTHCQERVAALTADFKAGNFGLTVACGVTILDTEGKDEKKLIDDGVSTVMALLACRAFFAGQPDDVQVPHNLSDIFDNGLAVKVVEYSDNDDREARECWNVARHDEESFTVRWSSVHQKVSSALRHFRLTGDWTQAKAAMLEFYGEGKEQTVGRWIRAAKGMDKGTIDLLKLYPKVKGAYVWDNSFLVVSTTRQRDKMSSAFAADAFKLLLEHDAELTAKGFMERVCRPLRLLEVWVCLMSKRYGSVATLSPALTRVTDHLRSWVGLASVRRCIEGSVVLHDAAGGIPECTLLVTEFDKCKAGGLPPPQRLPTDAERKAEEIASKKAAEAAEVAAREAAEKKERDEFEEAEAQRTAEVDMFVLASPPQSTEHPDRIVGCSKTPAQIAAEKADARLARVHFQPTVDGLLGTMRGMQSADRVVCLVEAPTSSMSGFITLIDVARKAYMALSEAYEREGFGPVEKWRTIVMVGSRFELIAKAIDKFKEYQGWSVIVVQLQRRDRQSARSRPAYAVVGAPSVELSSLELAVMVVPKLSAADTNSFSLALRCTESQCQWRPADKRDGAVDLAAMDGLCEIAEEDRADMMADMLADLDDQVGDADDQAAEQVDDHSKKRDAIVDLWPYAHPPAYYSEAITLLGAGVKAIAGIVVSTTPHPGHWLAFEKMGMETWVLTLRWSPHSFAHGRALGQGLLAAEELASLACAPGGSQECKTGRLQTIQATIVGEQLVEAYDIMQGTEWQNGINRAVPTKLLVPGSQGLVRKEAEKFQLRVTAAHADNKGRGLELTTSRRDGELVCSASALFFDDKDLLETFLGQNARFADRVVSIPGVKRQGKEVELWAVLVGVAQFIQHFVGYRTRCNVVLQFDPSQGFNDSLRVVVSTRTGGGIGAGQPVVLNYGPGFDLNVARLVSDDAYLGALDRLFADQRSRLPEVAERNDEQKQEEEEARTAAEEEAKREAAEASRAAAAKLAAELKEEEEAKKAAEAEAKTAAEEEAKRKRRQVAVGGCDDPEMKRAKIEKVDPILAKLSTSPCVLILSSDNKLVLRNPTDTNKKVSSDTILVAWSTGTSLSTSLSEGFEYKLGFKSDVINQKTMKRMKMDKFISESGQPVREIFGFEPFPPGSVPKILIKKGNKIIRWAYTGEDEAVAKKAVESARNSSVVSPLWIVRRSEGKQRVEPCGLALVLMKSQQVPGGGDVILA